MIKSNNNPSLPMSAIDEAYKKVKWELFRDRVESLLERWTNCHAKHPEISHEDIIQMCLLEINDESTALLIEK